MSSKYVYFFGDGKAEGSSKMRDLLGGKGANLHEMTQLGLAVPSGFTISTEVCVHYYANQNQYPTALKAQVEEALAKVEKSIGKKFGDARNPLLVSVRSGARASMPGMMDTVLNLGLNDETVQALAEQTGNARFAYDAYRRFIQMYSDVVLGVGTFRFESLIEHARRARNVEVDSDLTLEDLQNLVKKYKAVVQEETGKPFPNDVHEQLWGSIGAVFQSWMANRAVSYRRIHRLPDTWGTAVNVQSMVFGNMGDDSATGVAFTRDPSTGENRFFGEFLPNAQGEDVVAGIRTPMPINAASRVEGSAKTLEEMFPKSYAELVKTYQFLEKHFRDMQDIEFTIEKGRLFILQTRTGKRTASAAVRIAVEMVQEGVISEEEAILRVTPEQVEQLLHPRLDPRANKTVIAKGLPASPGAACGEVVFSSEEAEILKKNKKPALLVRHETSPEDIGGMDAAEGILTALGGMTCISGETRVLTDRGFLPAERAFGVVVEGAPLRILSVDSRTLRPVWRQIVAAGRRMSEVATISVSQTGRVDENLLRLTPDHKMYVFDRRLLKKKELEQVLEDQDFVQVVGEIPSLCETATSPALAYVAGALFSDGYISLKPTKGSVTFIQKPTPEKSEFIEAVERSFEAAFGVSFTYVRQRATEAELGGRTIRGEVEDRICFKREPAARLMEIRENLSTWVLSLDRTAILNFLAGYIDCDGTFAEESSEVRLQISMSGKRPEMAEAIALACLRLGIVPQITSNRENVSIQIVEKIEDIVAFTHRVRPETRARGYESRCLALRGLFDDIVDHVNFMGRVREGLKRNLMFGAEKIRRDILPLCPGESYREIEAILDSSLRSFRLKEVGSRAQCEVFNFEVDASHELDKNFIVFSSRLTPVLVSNSHAAVVARGMGKPCVAGCGAINIDYGKQQFTVGERTVKRGEFLTIDGSTGEVILGRVPTINSQLDQYFSKFMTWVDKRRRLRVRSNADTPHDAKVARTFGAEGVGLCRTEHMFFEDTRINVMREMILANHKADREAALAKLFPMQKEDFLGIFREMKDLPVTIRLLDPPLHEFLPKSKSEAEGVAAILKVSVDSLMEKVRGLHEFNPMLGHRGCRLGVSYPEIYEMQTRAIMEAACELSRTGFTIEPEIMVPFIVTIEEFRFLKANIERVCQEVCKRFSTQVDYKIGTMIEIPRAALIADSIATEAEFFSFGTNDLTQMTLGLSRDDSGSFLPTYIDKGIFAKDPFVSVDQAGVGELMKFAIERGKKTNTELKLGICGEQGGDTATIEFCHRLGLNYVSCSPFRVPVARLAAAQASLKS